jgi:hypothetical protein
MAPARLILMQVLSTHSCYSGRNPRAWQWQRCGVAFLSRYALWSSVAWQMQDVERLCLARSIGGDVKSCVIDRCYPSHGSLAGATYRSSRDFHVVLASGTWRHGDAVYRQRPRRALELARRAWALSGVDTRNGEDYADLYPEDCSVV